MLHCRGKSQHWLLMGKAVSFWAFAKSDTFDSLVSGFLLPGWSSGEVIAFSFGSNQSKGRCMWGSRRPQTVVVTTKHGKRQNRAQNRRSGQQLGCFSSRGLRWAGQSRWRAALSLEYRSSGSSVYSTPCVHSGSFL